MDIVVKKLHYSSLKRVDYRLHERGGKQTDSNFATEFAITFKLRFAVPLIFQLICRKVRITVGKILHVGRQSIFKGPKARVEWREDKQDLG
jgi:hypothetical protein